MSAGFSTYLNLLRFLAALVVLLSHFAYPRFTGGDWLWVRQLNLGSDAVVLFFVLSGFVIALTAERKDIDLSDFAFARATRLVSVALPALVLGWALDRWGAATAPEQYFAPFYAPLPLWETLLRGLSFSNEWGGGLTARLGSNGPYWSLSYEVAYYALFAIAYYLDGTRRAALLTAGVLLVGVNVLLLMPAWLMGVWLYRRLRTAAPMRVASAVVFAGLPVAAYALALRFDVPQVLQSTLQPAPPGHPLRFSDEYLWNALLGLLVCIHLLGVAALTRAGLSVFGSLSGRLSAPIAWLAGASFSIYLVHYPLLQALHALWPGAGQAGLFLATLALCFVFAAAFERPLHLWRGLLRAPWRQDRPHVTG